MFWHGLSLVSSGVKKGSQWSFRGRETSVNWIFVLGDEGHHRTAAFIGNQIGLCFWIHCFKNVTSVSWEPDFSFCWTVDFLSRSLHNASSRSRRSRPPFPPRVPPPRCWFGGFRRDLLAAVCPLTPPLSWRPLVRPFIFLSIHLFVFFFFICCCCSKRVLPLTG